MLNTSEVEAHARRCAEAAENAARQAKVESLRVSLELAKETGRFSEEQARQFGEALEEASGTKFMPPKPKTAEDLGAAIREADDADGRAVSAVHYVLVLDTDGEGPFPQHATEITIHHDRKEIHLS